MLEVRGIGLSESGNDLSISDGLGAGIVIAQNGEDSLILTNQHVIDAYEKARELVRQARNSVETTTDEMMKKLDEELYIDVVNYNGVRTKARIVGKPRNPNVDLALLRTTGMIDVAPNSEIASLESLNSGETVTAVGHPQRRRFIVTSGHCSSKIDGRNEPWLRNSGTNEMVIQHTAPIDHGNSGGPLFDDQGRVIGVNTLGWGSDIMEYLYAFPADYVLDPNNWEITRPEDFTLTKYIQRTKDLFRTQN